MHNRSPSEVSTHSSLEFSYSDVESISSHLNMDDIAQYASLASPVPTPPIIPTELDAPSVLQIPDDQPMAKPETKSNPIFFCETIVLVAEDRVFCVPKGALLEHGTYFRSIFGGKTHDFNAGIPAAGSSEQCPIILGGVSKIHFHNFLRVLYPFYRVDLPSSDEDWLGILDLATKWGFQEVRETALVHLEHLFTSPYRDPIRALVLCQTYDIHQHIKQQFEAIITSIKPLDSSAMLDGGLDINTALLLTSLSNRWVKGLLWGDRGSGTSNALPRRLSARKIVEDHFAASDPQPMSQEERNLDAGWIQDEVKRLEDEVRSLEAVGAEHDSEVKGEEESEAREKDDTPDQPEPPGDEGLFHDASLSTSEVDEFSDDTGAHIEKLILLHSDKVRVAELIQELKGKGANDADLKVQALANEVEAYDRKLQEYWGKVTLSRLHSQIWNDIVASCNSQRNIVELAGHDAQTSRQILEQLILNQLHPAAKSLNFGIKTGSGTINSQLRSSVMDSTLGR
ncbi:hypothetical protein BJ165DRAFT_1457737 [Panaeolus papilionaceus]|nr:hypothetical protein BJ165DRAFT_1457737 [Panaeolus papilionaceus]